MESPSFPFRAVGLKLSADGDGLGISSSVGTAERAPRTRQCLPSWLEPASGTGPTHPCVRRAGRRQPPEGVGRERERGRGLGRCRDPERGRGRGSLRWGSISASRALLPGRRRGR